MLKVAAKSSQHIQKRPSARGRWPSLRATSGCPDKEERCQYWDGMGWHGGGMGWCGVAWGGMGWYGGDMCQWFVCLVSSGLVDLVAGGWWLVAVVGDSGAGRMLP